MNISLKIKISTISLFIILALVWFFIPKPELIISIFIRLLSFSIAIYFVKKYGEWRLIFLALMFLLMATRQVLTLFIWIEIIEVSDTTRFLSELPGFLVTFLTLISISYIGLALSGKIDIIKKQKEDITTLNSLLPICANCGKVRDDEGYWSKLEDYIENHTESGFSHGLCEDCADELYGKESWYKKNKTEKKPS